jgi:hypothetical protein
MVRCAGHLQALQRQCHLAANFSGSVGDIQVHLQKIYGAEVSSSLISKVTDAVAKEVKA